MNPKMREMLLDRLANHVKGDGRLMEYLENSTPSRQTKMELRRKAEGMRRIPVWVDGKDYEELQKKYRGKKGGVDWGKVISDALGRGAK